MNSKIFLCTAVLGLCTLVSSIRADTVQFSVVSGTFAGNVPAGTTLISGAGSDSVTYQAVAGKTNPKTDTVTLTFTAVGSPIVFSTISNGDTETNVLFGAFNVSATGNNNDVAIDDTFTLTLDVTDPALGNGHTTANVTGSIQSRTDLNNDVLDITVNPFSIPGSGTPNLAFSFNGITDLSDATADQNQNLVGSVTYNSGIAAGPTVPSPAAMWGGLLLLGLLGASQLRRQQLA